MKFSLVAASLMGSALATPVYPEKIDSTVSSLIPGKEPTAASLYKGKEAADPSPTGLLGLDLREKYGKSVNDILGKEHRGALLDLLHRVVDLLAKGSPNYPQGPTPVNSLGGITLDKDTIYQLEHSLGDEGIVTGPVKKILELIAGPDVKMPSAPYDKKKKPDNKTPDVAKPYDNKKPEPTKSEEMMMPEPTNAMMPDAAMMSDAPQPEADQQPMDA